MKKKGSVFIPGLEDYINDNFVLRPHPCFREVELYTKDNFIPILSPASGKILKEIVEIHRPKRVLELGTGAGYSLLWMASARENPKTYFTSVDRNPNNLTIAENFWNASPYAKQHSLELIQAEIMESLDSPDSPDSHLSPLDSQDYDLVFVDSDKITYPKIAEWLLKNQTKEQIVVFDNVLWHGRILDPDPNKKSDMSILDFWEMIRNSKKEFTLYPAGDGLLVLKLP